MDNIICITNINTKICEFFINEHNNSILNTYLYNISNIPYNFIIFFYILLKIVDKSI